MFIILWNPLNALHQRLFLASTIVEKNNSTCVILINQFLQWYTSSQIRASDAHHLAIRGPVGVPLPEGPEPRQHAAAHQGKALQFSGRTQASKC